MGIDISDILFPHLRDYMQSLHTTYDATTRLIKVDVTFSIQEGALAAMERVAKEKAEAEREAEAKMKAEMKALDLEAEQESAIRERALKVVEAELENGD